MSGSLLSLTFRQSALLFRTGFLLLVVFLVMTTRIEALQQQPQSQQQKLQQLPPLCSDKNLHHQDTVVVPPNHHHGGRRNVLTTLLTATVTTTTATLPHPAAAAAPKDCFSDCVQNCQRIVPNDKTGYCVLTCQDYCEQDDRQDGLSGSVSSDKGEVGILGGTFGQGTVPQGQDKPPAVSLPGLNFESDAGRQLLGYSSNNKK